MQRYIYRLTAVVDRESYRKVVAFARLRRVGVSTLTRELILEGLETETKKKKEEAARDEQPRTPTPPKEGDVQ